MAETAIVAAIASATGASATTVVAVGAATAAAVSSIAISSYSAKKAEADARKEGARAPRDITVRSAIEPARIIYGTARTSGPVVYTNTAPTPGTSDNSTLWTVISLCQHEIDDITEIWLDGDKITSAQIDWAGTGGVTSGKYGPIGGNQVTNFYRRLGADTQTHVTQLATAFSDWTSDYDGKGVAYIVSAFELGTATGEGVWAQGAPQNIRAVVKGKKVYDPRKDSTQTGGSGAHRLADPTTWEWSDNPALCLADYLFDARLGMGAEGVTYDDIDWDLVFAAANACDTLVTSPDGNQKRFTCNGALSTGETYAENIKQLLSSMSGQITWSGGKYRIRAAAYEAPTYTFTGDDVIGDVQIQPERTRTQRYNKIRGTFIDPDSDYVATEFIPVENTSYKNTRDGGQTLTQEIRLPFTNDEYMAQRIAFKQLNLNNQQLRCIVPFNWKAMKVAVGDRIQLSIDELSWSNKVFRVDGWSFSPDSGFNLTLQEDSSSAYADPLIGDYSTRTLAGTVSFADQAVSAPSGLQATSEEEAILLEWDAPPRASGYDEVAIYASADSSWANASEIARTRGNSYRHELANGTTRYYWVRAVDVDGRESTRDPDSDTSSVTATAGQISTSQLNDDASFAETADWPQITGSGKPEDDATVGATVGTNLFDADGVTVLGTTDVKNSVLAQEILQVETEGEEILDLETGNEVDIQNLGDVAIFVNESNTTINTRINTTNTNLSNLQATVVDLTSGVSDIYLQATEPVAGVGGVPDPIPTFSRWYDTDDDNAPYYWDGSAWLSLEDPRIGQNEAAITSLSSRMTTAEGDIDANTAAAAANATDIDANASAISTLDTTVTSQGSTIASLSSQQTVLTAGLDFITKVEDEADQDPIDLETTGVLDLETLDDVTSATSSAITALDVRTTAAEGTLTTQATEITELQSVLSVDGEFSATVNAIETLGTRITSNDGELSTVAGQITALQNTVNDPTTGVDANATAISGLTTRVDSAEGNITVLTSEVVALEGILQDPDGNYSASANAIQTLETVLSDDGGTFSASSNAITELNSTVDGNTASITTQASTINGLEAQYTVKIDNNGRVSGFGLASTAADATPFSEFVVIADQFSVVDPASTASTPLIPFQIVSGKARFTTDVEVDGTLIVSGTISGDSIAANTIGASNIGANVITANEIAANTITADQLAANTITAGQILSNTITAEQIASDTITANEIAANTITSAEIAANTITADEIEAGTITATEIAANTITAAEISAGAIGATEISVTNLAAINSDLGTLTAGTIDASVVTVSNISASNISTGTLDASTVTVSNLNASNISTGTLNADRIDIDGVTLDTSGGSLIIATGGVQTQQVGTRAITNTARADMASNTNYSTSFISLASLTGQTFANGDLAEISWGLRAHPEASGAPYIAIRVLVYQGATLKATQYFVGDAVYDTTNWAQIQQVLFSSTMQYSITADDSDWRFILQAATNTNGTFPRTFRAPGTYIQAVRLKR